MRLEIQTYYFVPSSTSDKGSVRRNIVRTYNTARALVDLGLRLDASQAFLSHAPHFVFRNLLDAAAVALEALHSIYASDLDVDATGGGEAVKRALLALRRSAVREGDLATRAAKMMESYWALRHLLPALGVGMSDFPHRVGGVVVFDCLRRSRRILEEARKRDDGRGQAQGPEIPGEFAVSRFAAWAFFFGPHLECLS